VILWDPSEAQSVAVLEHGARPVRKLAFTPDGRLLVTISDDGWVRFWGMAD
jgi:WD40 repeat protein